MNSLTSICYVCLKTEDKSLININSSLSENKDILRIISYLPCDLAWLATEPIILICPECCLYLRKMDEFLRTSSKNSSILRDYLAKLNSTPASEAEERADPNSNRDSKSVIQLETQDAAVTVEDCWVQTFSTIKIEDGQEEALIGNSSMESVLEHQQCQGSGDSLMVRTRKRTKADSGAQRDEDTSGDSETVKKSKKNKPGTENNNGDDTGNKQQQKDRLIPPAEVAVWCGYIHCHTKANPVYRGNWLCQRHAPEQHTCMNSTHGCTYRDFEYKCEIHWNYFCQYMTECNLCGADITGTTLDAHYTQAHGTYRAGTVSRVIIDDVCSQEIVLDCDFGKAVCKWWLCDDDYELWLITPLASEQLCKYRCTVELSDPDTGFTLSYAPAARYNSSEYDWKLVVPSCEYNACIHDSHVHLKISFIKINDPLEYII